MRHIPDWAFARDLWLADVPANVIAWAVDSASANSVKNYAARAGWPVRWRRATPVKWADCAACGRKYLHTSGVARTYCPDCRGPRAECQHCGAVFNKKGKSALGAFCSRPCHAAAKSKTGKDGLRRCGACGERKPETAEHFYPKRDARRGVVGWTNDCRPCRAKIKRERERARGRPSRADYVAALGWRTREDRKVDDEVASLRALARKKMARWRTLYLRDNPACIGMNKSALNWRVRYDYDPIFRAREIMKARAKDSLANELSDGTLDARRVAALFAMARKCPYCEGAMRPGDKRLDHVRPLSRSGAHSIQNVVVCCATCNQSKLDADPIRWIRRKWPAANADMAWRRVMGQIQYNEWVTPRPKAKSIQRMGVQVAA